MGRRTGHRIFEVDGIMIAEVPQTITGDESGDTPGQPLSPGLGGSGGDPLIIRSDTRPYDPEVGTVRLGLAIEGEPEPTVLASDNFNRTENWDVDTVGLGASSGGQTWIKQAGTWSIQGNTARPYSGGADGACATAIDTGETDTTIAVKAVGTEPALYVRGAGAGPGTNDFSCITAVWSGGTCTIQEFHIPYAVTDKGTGASTLTTNDIISLTAFGSTITAKVNGTTVATATSTLNPSSTKHGLGPSSAAGSKVDDAEFTTAA